MCPLLSGFCTGVVGSFEGLVEGRVSRSLGGLEGLEGLGVFFCVFEMSWRG